MCTLSIHDLNLCQQYPEFDCRQCDIANFKQLISRGNVLGKVLENSTFTHPISTRYQPDITP